MHAAEQPGLLGQPAVLLRRLPPVPRGDRTHPFFHYLSQPFFSHLRHHQPLFHCDPQCPGCPVGSVRGRHRGAGARRLHLDASAGGHSVLPRLPDLVDCHAAHEVPRSQAARAAGQLRRIRRDAHGVRARRGTRLRYVLHQRMASGDRQPPQRHGAQLHDQHGLPVQRGAERLLQGEREHHPLLRLGRREHGDRRGATQHHRHHG